MTRDGEELVVILDEAAAPADGETDESLPEGAIRIDRRTVEYRLIDPVSIRLRVDGREREERFETIRLTRLRGKDLMDIEAAGRDRQTILAFARVTGLSEPKAKAIYNEMDQDDVEAVARIIVGFKGSGRRTGR